VARRVKRMDSPDPGPPNSNEAGSGDEPDADTLGSDLEQQMALVGPVLDGLFKAAATDDDIWLKKKSVRIFSDWIVSVLNVSQVMEQQVQALSVTVQAQEKELEQTRTVKAKMWTPGV
jgi:hypothetical protein